MTEFCLSHKIEKDADGVIRVEDIKEFIKKLKEGLEYSDEEDAWILNRIDKFAGEKLIENAQMSIREVKTRELEEELETCPNCETKFKGNEHDTEMCNYLNR